MINFREYLQQELLKLNDEQVKHTVVKPIIKKEETIEDIIYKSRPEIWTAREISGVKYLFFNNKFLNISELKNILQKIYTENGYSGYGFSKLSESELIRYTYVKNILIDFFITKESKEINPNDVADTLFKHELKDFEWKPEEY